MNYNLFETSLNYYLDTKFGQGCASLSYLLHNDNLHLDTTVILTKEEKIYWNAPLDGPDFKYDCKCVWAVILPLVVDTKAWSCFKLHNKLKTSSQLGPNSESFTMVELLILSKGQEQERNWNIFITRMNIPSLLPPMLER